MDTGTIIFLAFIIGTILLLGGAYLFHNRINVNRSKYVNSNQFANNNVYNNYQLISQILNQIEPLRQEYYRKGKTYYWLLIISLAGFMLSIFSPFLINSGSSMSDNWIILIVIGVFFLAAVIFEAKYYKIRNEYNARFKESNIIPMVISSYNQNLVYNPKMGYSKEEYDRCYFLDNEDFFNSNDGITDNRTGFFCADIHTTIETEDSQGNRGQADVFLGSLAKIPISYSNCEIIIGGLRNKGSSRYIDDKEFFSVSFEDDYFNSIFGVFATDKVEAYKIITPDVIEQLNFLKQNVFGDIDIRIMNNYLYVRFRNGDGFVPNLVNPKKEIDSILTSVVILEEVYKTTQNIKSIIESKL